VSDETPQEPATPETPASPETPAAAADATPDAPAADAAAPETPVSAADAPVADDAATAPTEETPVAPPAFDAPPTAASHAAAAPVAAAPVAAAPVATKERKSVAVPMSVLVTLGAILVAALMFGIGYAVGNSDDNDSAVSTPIGNGNFPQLPGGNQQTPNFPQLPGGNQQTPNNPNSGGNQGGNQQTSSPPFMGIATQQTNGGLQVTEVVASSAADKAGIQTGDVITEFDGDDVTTSAQLANAVAQHEVGDRVEVTYTREGQTKTVTVTLGTRTTSN
jgi:membrane-associated protease RseP (regulator of RpoE activity)